MKKVISLVLVVLLAALTLGGCTQTGKTEYVILDEVLATEEYGIGFRKADQSLRNAVQQALCDLKADGTAATITKEWFGSDISIIPASPTLVSAEDDSLQKVKNAGKLRVGLDDSFPPMGFRDVDQKLMGYDIDLARAVCEKLGVEPEFVSIDWDSKHTELDGNNIDCIWNGFTINDERLGKCNMTEPYLTNKQVVVTIKGSGIEKLTDLEGKSVVLQKGSTAIEALDDHPEIKSIIKGGAPIAVDNNVLAMLELKNGISDAIVMDEVVANYYASHPEDLARDGKAD